MKNMIQINRASHVLCSEVTITNNQKRSLRTSKVFKASQKLVKAITRSISNSGMFLASTFLFLCFSILGDNLDN